MQRWIPGSGMGRCGHERRDIFSMIFYGGGISLTIGLVSTAISTVLAMVLGALSGFAPNWLLAA